MKLKSFQCWSSCRSRISVRFTIVLGSNYKTRWIFVWGRASPTAGCKSRPCRCLPTVSQMFRSLQSFPHFPPRRSWLSTWAARLQAFFSRWNITGAIRCLSFVQDVQCQVFSFRFHFHCSFVESAFGTSRCLDRADTELRDASERLLSVGQQLQSMRDVVVGQKKTRQGSKGVAATSGSLLLQDREEHGRGTFYIIPENHCSWESLHLSSQTSEQ